MIDTLLLIFILVAVSTLHVDVEKRLEYIQTRLAAIEKRLETGK